MQTDILQPWVTVQGNATSVTQIVQEEESWLDLADCADASIWLDVRGVTPATSTSSVVLLLESSPTKDEAFFLQVATVPLLSATQGPVVIKSVPRSGASNPIARWLRWRLLTWLPTTSGTWGATFRIRVARSRTPFFSPNLVPGCKFWFRPDIGATFLSSAGNSTGVSALIDLSGNNNNLSAGTGGAPVYTPASPALFPAPTLQFGVGSNGYLKIASSAVTIPQPSSLLFVAELTTTATPGPYYVSGGGASVTSVTQLMGSATTIVLNAGVAKNVTVGSMLNSGLQIIQVDWSGSSTELFQNGLAQGGVNAGTNSLTLSALGATSTGANFITGYMGEVIAFYPQLTATWRTLVTRYLGQRYSISVP